MAGDERAVDLDKALADTVLALDEIAASATRTHVPEWQEGVISFAGVARATNTLDSMRVLCEQGRPRADLGTLLRSIYETWLVTRLTQEGGPAVVERLQRGDKHEMEKLYEGALADMPSDVRADLDEKYGEREAKELPLRAKHDMLVKYLGRNDKADEAAVADLWYSRVFEVESFGSTHASLTMLDMQLTKRDDGRIEINVEVEGDRLAAPGRLRIATQMVLDLAIEAVERCDGDASTLRELVGLDAKTERAAVDGEPPIGSAGT
jgi:Family of unknown function (DUF5677)